jgi:hypothetical protein
MTKIPNKHLQRLINGLDVRRYGKNHFLIKNEDLALFTLAVKELLKKRENSCITENL